MKKILLILFLSSLLFATQTPVSQELNAKKADKILKASLKEQSLIYTQKHAIKVGNDAGMLIFTYLNPMLAKSAKGEIFILSIAPKFLKISSLHAVIQGELASIKPLSYSSSYLDLIVKNSYAKYYLVTVSKNFNVQRLKSELCVNKTCFSVVNQKIVKSLFFRSKD